MPTLGTPELLIVLAIVVVLFGASRIPEVMGGMGRGIREFRRAAREDDTPTTPAAPAPTASPVDASKHDVV
jgi:sec-independent protein translocase protein TatA